MSAAQLEYRMARAPESERPRPAQFDGRPDAGQAVVAFK